MPISARGWEMPETAYSVPDNSGYLRYCVIEKI